jgi:dTDP-glucose 4,6-dehydratase
MTRILLTGASGFAGSHVLHAILADTDWSVTCLASWQHFGEPRRVLSAVGRVEDVDLSRIQLITHDLSVPLTPGVIRDAGMADIIMNVASDSHVDRSIASPVPFVKNNVAISLTMLEHAQRTAPRMFLQMGTDEVYGPMLDGRLNVEWDTTIPSNPYSASKAAQDALSVAWWRTFGVPVVLTRTMNLFGPFQSGEKFIPMVVRKVLAGEPVTIHSSPDGQSGSRCWIDVRELASAWLYLAQNHTPARYPDADRPDLFHIVGEQRSNLEIAQLIAEILGKPLRHQLVSFHESRPGHDLFYGLDGTKLAKAGWENSRSLPESLAETVEWYASNPAWLEI